MAKRVSNLPIKKTPERKNYSNEEYDPSLSDSRKWTYGTPNASKAKSSNFDWLWWILFPIAFWAIMGLINGK